MRIYNGLEIKGGRTKYFKYIQRNEVNNVLDCLFRILCIVYLLESLCEPLDIHINIYY